MKEIVAARYPGTRTSVSEYNWGGLEHINGALAQADVLGIFGREGLDAAMLWAPGGDAQPWAHAFRMYRDYDGAGSRFGDVSVRATSGGAANAGQGQLAAYAAQRTADGAVTVMVVNKTGGELTSSVALSGATFGAAAQVYRYSAANLGAIQHLADAPVSGGAVSLAFPANSITLLVLPTTDGAPQPAATALTASVTPDKAVYGQSVTMSGRLTSAGAGVAGKVVALEGRRAGTTTWTAVSTATTLADGTLSKKFAPKWSGAFRWRWPGDGAYAASASPAVNVTVYGKLVSVLSVPSMALGSAAKVSGSVAPAHPGGPYAVDRYTSRGWQPVGSYALSSTSTYTRSVKPATRGTYYYRVRWLGDADHAARTGPTLTLKVT
jgi:hypothetical protein